MKIDKLVVGIRTVSKMFRVQALGGVVLDNILALRGKEGFSDDYYTEVTQSADRFQYGLKNDKLGNYFHVDTEGIVFTKDNYDKDSKLSLDKVIQECRLLWEVANSTMKIDDIRRIGIVAEHQISTKDNPAAKKMIETFTKFKQPAHSGRFMLRYEDRRPTKEALAPDIEKSDFLNVIYSFYEGDLDAHHPKKDALNANIDVQRYFSPLLKKSCFDEVNKLAKLFDTEKKSYEDKLKGMGVLSNG